MDIKDGDIVRMVELPRVGSDGGKYEIGRLYRVGRAYRSFPDRPRVVLQKLDGRHVGDILAQRVRKV
jgi:hypothetical protein